jgi:hypothetical protein
MKKWTDNKFLTLIGTMLALILNEKLHLDIDIDRLMPALIVSGQYIAMQYALDHAKGEATRTFNSRKLIVMLGTCTIIIVSEYIGFDLMEIIAVTGVGAGWITMEAVNDYKRIKKGDTVSVNTKPANTFESNK